MQPLPESLVRLAVDLTASLAGSDRLARMLRTVREVIPCDATAVLAVDGTDLVPLAVHGLAPEVLGRRFARAEHPRLDTVLRRGEPVLFPADSPLPDPYDGLVLANPDATRDVHACLACPLVDGDRIIGVLTADALEAGAFDGLDPNFLRMLGALAGAALHTARLIDALESRSLQNERVARTLQREAALRDAGDHIIGTSDAIQRVRDEIDLVAASGFAVLVSGETGVGKELVARAVHDRSARRERPLIHVNCAALPESIVESELFGHRRGAYTGAVSDRAGMFEVADGGTLFLDEIGELPLSVQPKLLRVLQEGEIQRVGAERVTRVDVRVVAATNRDLAREVESGRFRADLFHRLNMFPIRVPPLRERRRDVALLAGHFLDVYRRRLGLGPVLLTEASRVALAAADWPGNVRELDHALGRAVLRASVGIDRGGRVVVEPAHLQLDASADLLPAAEGEDPTTAVAVPWSGRPLRESVEDFKRRVLREAVAASGGNWAAAARALGMERGNLHQMARRLGLRP